MKTKALRVNNIWLLLRKQLPVLCITGVCLLGTVVCSDNLITTPGGESSDTTGANHVRQSPVSQQQTDDNHFTHITNGALPMDREVTVYVLSGEAKRLYYQIHSSKPEMALTVTPCESTIAWKLSYLPQKGPKNKERKPRLRRRYKRRHNKFMAKNVLNNAKPSLLTNYTGNGRHTYADVSTAPGLYILDFNSMGRDVSLKIYVSEHYPYPLLPNSADIHVDRIGSHSVTISWPASPSETIAPVDYCVAISTDRKFADNCLMDSYLKDAEESYELDLLPSDASTSFTYWWGRTVKNMLRQSRLKSMADHKVRVECVAKNRTHLIHGLDNRRNTQYFVDVFARNTATNSTSMYRTVNVTLINTEPLDVVDSLPLAVHLNQSNNFTQRLNYKVLTDGLTAPAKLWLFLQTCSGLGTVRMTASAVTLPDLNTTLPVHTYRDQHLNQTLFTRSIFSLKTMEITFNDRNVYQNQSFISFELNSSLGTDRSAVFMISNRHNRFPFPLLPEDTRLKVMHTLTDCHSVTLAWNASPDDKVQYCVYVRPAHTQHSAGSIAPMDNVCADHRLTGTDGSAENDIDVEGTGSPRKVLCKRYHKSSKRRFNNKIIQSVKRLSSGQTYVFQVLVTKYKGQTLAYEQVWASTKPKYQCH